MKKIIIVSAFVLAFTGYSQKKQIVFDKALEYSFKSNDSNSNINYYLDETAKFSLIESFSSYSPNKQFSILNNGKYIKIDAIGFDRSILVPKEYGQTFPLMEIFGNFFSSNIVLEAMNKKGNFMGLPCDYYSIKSDAPNESNLVEENVCLCIDVSNKVKNLKALLPNANLDGLILAYGHVDYPGEELSLDVIRNVDIKLDFDFNTEYKQIQDTYSDHLKSIENDNYAYVEDSVITSTYYDNYYNDPLCNNYEYFSDLEENTRNYAYKFSGLACDLSVLDSDYDGKPDMTREQAIQIAKKQSEVMIKQGQKTKIISKEEAKKLSKVFEKLFKASEDFVPEVIVEEEVDSETWTSVEDDIDYSYRNYSSDYKSIQIENVTLAAETQLDYPIKDNMPDYCFELKQNVPNFKNENLKTHVYNLVGQICDLYIYQNGGSVDYFLTIDSMRKSILEIDNMRGELSKNDTKLLNEYLNSLD